MNDDDVVIETDGTEEGGSEEELEATESRMDAKASKLKKELDQVKKEKQEYLDGWQRAQADYVNALKRFEGEKAGAVELGKMLALSTFLPPMDSLGRAEATGEVPESFKGIARQLHEAAAALGLVMIGAVGESFDPNLHEALGQDPVQSKDEDDKVTAVLEPGWKSKESVIRPAKVRVSHYEG